VDIIKVFMSCELIQHGIDVFQEMKVVHILQIVFDWEISLENEILINFFQIGEIPLMIFKLID